MPIGRINEIMQVSAGMGKTGQAYLVGQDLLVRNDARFSTASEVLKTTKPAAIVNKALEGISGTRQVVDDTGRQKLVTYTSITFAGQAWAIITEFDLEEILAPVDEMRRALILAGAVIGVVVVVVGSWFSARLSRPISSMTGIMHRLAERGLAVEIPDSQRADEIGDMEKALAVFKESAIGRKRAEEEVAKSHDILQALADNIPEFVSLKDPQLKFLFVNRRFEEWVGMNRDAVVGKAVGDIYSREQAEEFDALDRKVLASEAVSRREVDLTYPDGKTRSVISTRFPVVSAAGESLGLGTVNVDVAALREVQAELKKSMEELTVEVNARKRAEEELRVANSELQELNEMKNKFLGMAAHDLRNPLGVIRGMSHMILASDMEEQTKTEFLTSINEVSDQMLSLIDDLLDVSAIESGNFELQREKTDFGALLISRVEIAAMIAKEKDIAVTMGDTDVPAVDLDPARISQVIDNLLSNAIKFSPQDTVIETALRSGEGTVDLVVRDHGQGIPEHEVGKVFEAFEKLSTRPTAGEKSTGLGMAIVKRIIDAHGGTIAVESTLGEGTTFTVSPPLTKTT